MAQLRYQSDLLENIMAWVAILILLILMTEFIMWTREPLNKHKCQIDNKTNLCVEAQTNGKKQ